MKLYELLIDDELQTMGVEAISIVENPAIGVDFVALNEDTTPVQLAEVSSDKRLLMGAALIPDKPIYRNQDGEEFYIYFSQDTVRKAAEMFFKNSNHQNATLEHKDKLAGMTVYESWIVEDTQFDKSRKYGLDMPVGTWMVTMKVDDEDVWSKYVKDNKVFGFSIEGQFANALRREVEQPLPELLSDQKLDNILAKLSDIVSEHYELKKKDYNLETYNDYPQSASNNAKRAIAYKKKYGSEVKGMTQTGWTRAGQLARREKLSRSTIARMASFKRHQKNAVINPEYKSTPWKDNGYIAWLGWGGASGVEWAIRKLKSIDKK